MSFWYRLRHFYEDLRVGGTRVTAHRPASKLYSTFFSYLAHRNAEKIKNIYNCPIYRSLNQFSFLWFIFC